MGIAIIRLNSYPIMLFYHSVLLFEVQWNPMALYLIKYIYKTTFNPGVEGRKRWIVEMTSSRDEYSVCSYTMQWVDFVFIMCCYIQYVKPSKSLIRSRKNKELRKDHGTILLQTFSPLQNFVLEYQLKERCSLQFIICYWSIGHEIPPWLHLSGHFFLFKH